MGLQQVLPKQARSRTARSTSNQWTRTKTQPKTYVIKTAKQTTRRSKTTVTNAPAEDNWTGAWATAIGPEQASNPPPTDAKQPRPRFKGGILDETPVADQPANKKPRPRFKTGILQAPQETPGVNPPAVQRARPRFQKGFLD
ncbi:MAG: hypothetical protein ACKPKO_04860, partial [Candidatus Fonsibacter sp.]